jgi:SAM-dependent methyltransferase
MHSKTVTETNPAPDLRDAPPPPANDPLDPFRVGLHDAELNGWYNKATGELMHGCPIGPEDVVLDVGCGDAGAMAFCANRGAHVILADVDGAKIAKAAERLAHSPARKVQFFETDCDPLPLPDATATRVVCTEVLEHVDDPTAFMAELVRVGRPGAIYLLSVPDPAPEGLQQHLAPAVYFQKPNHIRIFEREEFAELVRKAGLTVEQRYYQGYFWAMWWVLFWQSGLPLETAASNPVLENWTRTWQALLDSKDGLRTKRLLDRFMPKSQLIVARKP